MAKFKNVPQVFLFHKFLEYLVIFARCANLNITLATTSPTQTALRHSRKSVR